AEEMHDAGLVSRVVPAADLDDEVDRLARRLADGPTRAIGAAKRLLTTSYEHQMERQLQLEAEAFADCSLTDDFAEGVAAFVDKRAPHFTGR
ncbi:MAG: enoyl-CoA hydratase, partial [Acidimicrobiia bacterium]|nr:enoyl-CoA hydratase [Acidimicrobiia bacterium]